ncbi:HET-domain-containing protein, partial [Setomelanomma holmii]
MSHWPEVADPNSTASEACFSLARKWMKNCIRDHPPCTEVYNSQVTLPTRLLDLRTVVQDSLVRMRIVNPTRRLQRSDELQYIALSHRWPSTPMLCLTSSTYGRLQEGIPIDELPVTFQHAVRITLRLGPSYLWIDSLCIVQDSVSDWTYESANMGDIYRGSLCTIVAMQSASPETGCFTMRAFSQPSLSLSTEITLDSPKSYTAEKLEMPSGDLLRRGWVVQERVLSSRSLYYDTDQLHWECISSNANEMHPAMTDFNDTKMNPKRSFVSLLARPATLVALPNAINWNFYQAWTSLLTYYTACALTHSNDRLIAFQGMIAVIQQETGFQSLAGIWKELIHLELLWFKVPDSASKRGTLANSRLPTWSWITL